MDVLSDVLAVMRLGTALVSQAELVPPWGLEIDPQAEAHVHVVQRGSCWLRTASELVQLGAGDVVLIRSGVGHALSDSPETPLAPHREVLADMPRRLVGNTKPTTVVFCAKYLLQTTGPHPLTTALPPLVHLLAREAERHTQLMRMVQLLQSETLDGGRGSELLVPRLVEGLLLLVMRAWLDAQPVAAGGWFEALRDPAIAKALACIHERPGYGWTVERLAKQAAQSRATFARRFTELIGEPPIAYLLRWRMCIASKLLHESTLSVEDVAARVGYETAAAFSKAFTRCHGCAPGRYRAGAG
jgi:AraC-like DNA-binding protein